MKANSTFGQAEIIGEMAEEIRGIRDQVEALGARSALDGPLFLAKRCAIKPLISNKILK